jgi:hypothetical protein
MNKTPNLTVHSGIKVDPAKFRQKDIDPPELDMTKGYVSITITEGDNLGMMLEQFLYQADEVYNEEFRMWHSPFQGKVPIGWAFSMLALDLAPDILAYFYETATPRDCIYCAASGIGLMDPTGSSYEDLMRHKRGEIDITKVWNSVGYGKKAGDPDEILDDFLEMTDDYMKKLDMDLVLVPRGEKNVLERYASRISGLSGIMADYGVLVRYDLPGKPLRGYGNSTLMLDGGVPALVTVYDGPESGRKTPEGVRDRILKIASGFERPVFMSLMSHWGRMRQMAELKELLPEDFVLVRPDELVHLYREYLDVK